MTDLKFIFSTCKIFTSQILKNNFIRLPTSLLDRASSVVTYDRWTLSTFLSLISAGMLSVPMELRFVFAGSVDFITRVDEKMGFESG